MGESLRPIPVPRPGDPADRLDSWKEIAAYLGREVRTVQGWEKNEALPIHRHQHAKQGSVYAFKSELDAWRLSRREAQETSGRSAPVVAIPAKSRWVRWTWIGGALAAVILLAWTVRYLTKPAMPSSIVVLPFLDMSPEKDQESFSDGLTEEIIDALSRVPDLHVVARTSAFAFKGKAVDIREIGRQLNVEAVLEGSVRKAGDQLRITAQVNRVSDGYHLWSQTYDRQVRDVFAVQQDISQSIAQRLRGASPAPARPITSDLEAYRLYQEGRFLFNQHRVPDSYLAAISRYEKAIARDPNFALAYSGLADARTYLAENMGIAPKEAFPEARRAALKAVELDDNLAEVHTSLGMVKLDYEWDIAGARREFQRAAQLSPGSGWVHHWIAHSLEAQTRIQEALVEMRQAQKLDPLSIPIYWDIANELIHLNRYDEALAHLKKGDELFPNYPILLFEQVLANYRKGDRAAGRRAMEHTKSVLPLELLKFPAFVSLVAYADAADGREADARRALTELEAARAHMYVDAFWVVPVCHELKDHACVSKWFKRAYEERSSFFPYVATDPQFYKGDPELEALVATVH